MSAVMNDGIPRHRITVDEYYRMAEADQLAPDARVELLDGEIIDMPPPGSLHTGTVMDLNERLSEALGRLAQVRGQSPIRLDAYSEPQPDLAVVKRRDDYYKGAHPTPSDVLLVVEVSETTLARDLTIKVPLYAQHDIPEVWIVEPGRMRIRFFRAPESGLYTNISMTEEPGLTRLMAMANVEVDLAALFGRQSP
jgi:Uma2 family endonuclease